MKTWLRGFRGAFLLTLTWILGWGVGFGGLIEAFVDPRGELIDIWPAAMAVPGFIGGIVLSALLRVFDRGRSVDEVSLPRVVACGMVTGLILGVLAVAIGLTSDIAIDQPYERSVSTGVMIGITTALGAVAAIGSALFFRLLARGEIRSVATR